MKKWTYLAVAGMLLGSAPVFTGCVDTDEPWGVEQLRGAKAELLKAKAAVEQANAQWVLADATYREAIARWQNALALQAEYDAEAKRLENDIQAARNEKEKLDLQKQMEELQQKMEENALKHQTEMLNLQKTFELTKRQYELLLQAIEIAEAIGSEQEQVTISSLKADVQKKYAILYGGNYTENGVTQTITLGESLYQILQDAQQLVYDISLNHAHGIINKVDYIPTLELEVEKNQVAVDAAKEALTKLQEFLEKDTETADWRAEIAALEESIDAIEKELDAKYVELAKAKNSEAYLAASQTLYGVYSPDKPVLATGTAGVEGALATEYPTNWEDAVQDGAWQIYKRSEQDLYKLKVETEFELKGDKMETEVSNSLNGILQALEGQMGFASVTDWQNGLAYDDITYRYYYQNGGQEFTPSFDIEKGEYPSTIKGAIDVKDLFGAFQHWKEVLAEATENNYQNAIEVAKIAKTKLEAEITKTIKPAYDAAVSDWNIALKAYSKGEAGDITKDTDYKAISDVFAAYNTQYEALVTAIKAYNDERTSKYTTAYNKYMDEAELDYMYTEGLNATALTNLNGFNMATAQSNVSAIKVQTRTAYEEAIRNACTSVSGGDTKAQVEAKALAAIESYVATIMENDKSLVASAQQAGNTAAAAVKKDGVGTVVTKLNAEADKLDAAFAEFDKLAAYPFGQVRTKEAIAASSKDNIAGVYDETSKKNVYNPAGYTNELDKDGKPTGNLAIAVSKIEAAEITKATAAKVDESTAEAAWHQASDVAFGNRLGYADQNYRATQPSEEEILAAAEITGDTSSKGYALAIANQEVAEYDNAINTVADLGKLKTEVDAAYDALVKKFQTEYDATFADAEKAIEEAEAKLLSADATLMREEAKLIDIKAEIGKLEAQKNAETAVKDQLILAVTTHLGIEWPVGSGVSGNYDPASFEEDLQNAVLKQKEILNTAQKALSEAQIALEKAKDGQFDDLSYAQLQLNIAQYNFDQAWTAYQEALSNLEKGLAVIAEETPDEQPAE